VTPARTGALPRPLARLCAVLVALVLVAGCSTDSGPTREAVRGFLDATYDADPARANTWRSGAAVDVTADQIAGRVGPRDRFTEEQATFMRNRDYVVAVFPEQSGSRVELDRYEQMRNRYPILIGGYWGGSPRSYGPRGEGASRTGGGVGGFRGGGPGAGK
jgi:hypothetical protein